ncbi:hypothetical protein [Nonomuraea bangladeshensis]|uniref:hypothetical protein n=1 Tax=Nonomuraea bangladeshensis TaxID=404385 RepID=UPI003C2BC30E
MSRPTVAPGQVWAHRDDRSGWRYVSLADVDDRHAYVLGLHWRRIPVAEFEDGSRWVLALQGMGLA